MYMYSWVNYSKRYQYLLSVWHWICVTVQYGSQYGGWDRRRRNKMFWFIFKPCFLLIVSLVLKQFWKFSGWKFSFIFIYQANTLTRLLRLLHLPTGPPEFCFHLSKSKIYLPWAIGPGLFPALLPVQVCLSLMQIVLSDYIIFLPG